MHRSNIIFTLGLCFSLLSPLAAQDDSRFADADSHALAAPHEAEQSVQSLARYLTGRFSTDENKARAIFRWIAENIEYDVDSYFSGKLPTTGTDNVLSSRSSVCDGYASLFESLAKSAGLTAAKVSGYSKGYGHKPGEKLSGKTDHAWSAVKINGEWKLIDCTWGAGYADNDKKFKKSFNPHYFCTPPEEFIYGHFPEDPRWQLLDPLLTKKEFEALPYAKPAYFTLKMRETGTPIGVLHADGEIILEYRTSSDVLCMADLTGNGRNFPSACFVQRNGPVIQVRCTPPSKGDYTLDVYAKEFNKEGSYDQAVSYAVRSQAASADKSPYPASFGKFSEGGAILYSPMNGSLESSRPQLFRIRVPKAEKVAVVIGKEWEFLDRTGDLFEKNIEIGAGKISLMAQYPGGKSFEGLLEYTGTGSHIKTESPIEFKKFIETGAKLYSPLQRQLSAGSIQKFSILAPGAERIAVIINNSKWNFLEKNGNLFEGTVTVEKGTIGVFGKYVGGEEFQGLVEFKGE